MFDQNGGTDQAAVLYLEDDDQIDLNVYLYEKEFGISGLGIPYEHILLNLGILQYYSEKQEAADKKASRKSKGRHK